MIFFIRSRYGINSEIIPEDVVLVYLCAAESENEKLKSMSQIELFDI